MPSTLRPFNAMRDFRSTFGLVRSKASRTGAASAYEFVDRGIVFETVGMKERTSFAYAAAVAAALHCLHSRDVGCIRILTHTREASAW